MRLTRVIGQIKSSIVQIQAELKDNNNVIGIVPAGTGFIVENDLAITALHVIKAISKANGRMLIGVALNDDPSGRIKIRGSFILSHAEVVKIDEMNDIALLQLTGGKKFNLLTSGISIGDNPHPVTIDTVDFDIDLPENGELIATSGYPLSEPQLVTSSGIIASNWTLEEGQERFLADMTINRGNSGGPVYLHKNGKVIGVSCAYRSAALSDSSGDINSDGLTHNSGLSLVVPAEYVVRLIDSYKSAKNVTKAD